MTHLRDYAFELCWLLLLLVILALSPARPRAEGFSMMDYAMDCSATDGWCIVQN
jgi:hypothetical protein